MRNRRTTARRVLLVTSALAVIGCTETVGPRRGGPGTPLFSYSASGITVNQVNGLMRESGQLLIKGFNPTNPHPRPAPIAPGFSLPTARTPIPPLRPFLPP